MSVELRCTQCATTNHVAESTTKYGGGNQHGTEVGLCTGCSDTCGLDECIEESPCEKCHTETVQNRCGSSVPTAAQ